MRGQRAHTVFSSVRPISKKHCPDDLACCNHCCKCVEPLKNQNKILSGKIDSLTREKSELQIQCRRLCGEIRKWEGKKRELDDLEGLKARLREEMKKEEKESNKVEDIIRQEKYQNTKRERDALRREKEAFLTKLQEIQPQLEKAILQLKRQKDKVKSLEDQLTRKSQEVNPNDQLVLQLKARTTSLESALKQKTNVIQRIESVLTQSERNYILLRSKAASSQVQSLRVKGQVKEIADSLTKLKKLSQQKNVSIDTLSKEKDKLQKLVGELDSTVYSYGVLEGQLRQRIVESEDCVLRKELQLRNLSAEFYQTVLARSL